MKLTFRWNETAAEGRMSEADVANLRAGYDGVHITELDFLQDCIGLLTDEYNFALSTFLKGKRANSSAPQPSVN